MGVAAGCNHSLAVSAAGRVFAWGNGLAGQQHTPTLVTALHTARVVEVAAGSGFSLALSDDGRLFSWGCGYGGQLGRYSATAQIWPVKMKQEQA